MLIVRRSKLYYAASGIITPIGGRPVGRNNSNDVNMNFVFSLLTLPFLEKHALQILILQVLYALILNCAIPVVCSN